MTMSRDVIAGLIADGQDILDDGLENENLSRMGNLRKILAALQGLAQENERLKEWNRDVEALVSRQHQRIAELEAERDDYKQAAEVEAGLRREFKAECDAIRAKTFKECIEAVAWYHGTAWIVDKLRALAQTDETKVHQGD